MIKKITLIHIGDIHGHLVGRMHMRRDSGHGQHLGGLARLYSKIQALRAASQHSLLINTGDTIQGSAEALFTRGAALVEVLNHFAIDCFAPGNWDFVYGTERFIELFAAPKPLAPWNALAANLYYDGEPYATHSGQRVLPPYAIKVVDGIRLGILGFTTDRGPNALGKQPTKGFKMSGGEDELREFIPLLREQERVNAIIMISELGLANNIRLAKKFPGIDVILSSDMHEITRSPVRIENGTLIVEEGQDGTVLGEIELQFDNGRLSERNFTSHSIDQSIVPDAGISAAVERIRREYVSGPHFVEHVNPINGTRLRRPLDSVVGQAAIALCRSDFSDALMPGVIEGSSHDFLSDAFRAMAGAEIGAIRGFRYGTHVAPGPITLDDLYHFMPIGPLIAAGDVEGKAIRKQLEKAAHGCLSPDVTQWTGGWMFGYSGLSFALDPYKEQGQRISDAQYVAAPGMPAPLDDSRSYRYASYFYRHEPAEINGLKATNIELVSDEDNEPLDATEVVVRYLATLPGQAANPLLGRIRLARPLPAAAYGNPEIQPLEGCKPDDA